MKNFTTEEIRDLFNQVMIGEISFPEMVEIMNERISETGKPNFKKGDFLHSDWDDENITIIFKNRVGDNLYYHASKSCYFGVVENNGRYWRDEGDFRLATEEEKQDLIDALAKEGKRWNEEKKCVEDIPKRKFKKGDKVKIKNGVSSKTNYKIRPGFLEEMDELIGTTMTVSGYSNLEAGYVSCNESGYVFLEDWLEPYVEELKKGDLAIFWDDDKAKASIQVYNQFRNGFIYTHEDHTGNVWANAIRFESKEQYKRLLKGEL